MTVFIDRNIVKHSEQIDYSNEIAHRKRPWVEFLGAGTGLTCGPTTVDKTTNSGWLGWRIGVKRCWQIEAGPP